MITRFAPSPTGPLHLGHAYSALLAHDMARSANGTFLLRIEDIDRSRARVQWEDQIYDDLQWLGLSWPSPVMHQSDRSEAYHTALLSLWERGFLYPCTCTRRDIQEALSAPQEGVLGPDGPIYPGTCKHNATGAMPKDVALRLHIDLATAACAGPISFLETGHGNQTRITMPQSDAIHSIGDIAVARPDMGTSYHLSVVLDDAAQGVTHVVRGADLFEATKIHVILQRLLALATPTYHHHRLIRDDAGKRLAKRDDARAIAKYRADGISASQIRQMIGL